MQRDRERTSLSEQEVRELSSRHLKRWWHGATEGSHRLQLLELGHVHGLSAGVWGVSVCREMLTQIQEERRAEF